MSKSINYRNKQDLTTPEGVVIDAGSLFILEDGVLTLVDDDFYFETDFDLNLFKKA